MPRDICPGVRGLQSFEEGAEANSWAESQFNMMDFSRNLRRRDWEHIDLYKQEIEEEKEKKKILMVINLRGVG